MEVQKGKKSGVINMKNSSLKASFCIQIGVRFPSLAYFTFLKRSGKNKVKKEVFLPTAYAGRREPS